MRLNLYVSNKMLKFVRQIRFSSQASPRLKLDCNFMFFFSQSGWAQTRLEFLSWAETFLCAYKLLISIIRICSESLAGAEAARTENLPCNRALNNLKFFCLVLQLSIAVIHVCKLLQKR